MNFDPYVLQQRYKEGQGTSEASVYSEAFHSPNAKKPAPVQHGDQASKGANTPPISKLTSKIQGFFHMDHNKSEEKPKSGASTPGVREPGMPTDLSKYRAKNAPTPFVNTAANPQKSASTSGMASIPGTLPKVEETPSPQPKKNDEVKTPSQPQQNTKQEIKQNPTPNLVDDLISTSPPKQNATTSPQGYQQTNENKFNQSPKLQNQPVYNPYMAQYSQSQVVNRTSQPLDILSDLPAPAMLPNSPQQPKMAQNTQSPNFFGSGAKSVDPFATPLQNRQNDIFGNATPPQQPKQKEVTKQFDIFSTNQPTSQKKSNEGLATFEIFGVPPMSPPGQNNFSPAPTQQQNVKQTPPQPKAPIDILPPAQKKSHNGNSQAPVDQHKFDEFDPLKSQNVTKPPQKPAPQQQKAPVQQQPPAQKPVQAKQPQQTLHSPTVTKNADNLTPSPKPNPSPQPQKAQQQPVKESPLKAEQKQAKPEVQAPQKEAPVQSPIKEVPVQSPVKEVPAQSLVQEVPVQSPVQEVPVQSLMQEIPVESPVQEVPVQSPVQYVPVQSPVQEVPVQSPVQEVPAAQPEQNAEQKPEEQVVEEIKPAEERSGETLLSSQPHEEGLLYNPFGQPTEQSQPQETKEEEPKQDALAFNPFAQQQPQPEPAKNEEDPKQDALAFNPFNETQPAPEEKQEEPKKDVLSYNPFNDYQPEDPKPELENLPPAYGMFAQQQQQPVEQKQEEPKPELYNPFGGEQKPAQQEEQKQKEEAVMFDPFAGEQKQVQQAVEEVKPAQNQQQNSYDVFAQPQVPVVEQQQQQPVEEKPKEELYNPFGETQTTVEVAVENKQQEVPSEPIQAVENKQQNSYDLFGQPAIPQEPVVQQQETNLYNPFGAPPQPVEPEPVVVSREVELGGDLLDLSNQPGDDEIPIQNEDEQVVQAPSSIPPSSPITMSAPLVVEVTDSSSFEEPPHEEEKIVVNAQPTLETVKEEEPQPTVESVPEPAISFNPFGNAQPEPVKQEEPKTDALAFNPFAQTETVNTAEPVKEEEPKVDALAFNPFAQQEAQPVKVEEPQQDALLSNPFNETSVVEPVSEPVKEEPKTDEVKVDATISFNPFGNSQPEPAKEEEQKTDALAFNPFNAPEEPATVEEPAKTEEPQVDALASNPFNEPQEEVKTEAPAVEVNVQQPEEPKQDALAFNPFSQTEPQPEPVKVEEEPKQDALAFNPFASSAPAEETKPEPVQEEPKVDALAFNPFSEAQQPASEEKHEEVKVEATVPQPEEPQQDALAFNPFSESLAEPVKQEEPKNDVLAFNPFALAPAVEEPKPEEKPQQDALAFNPFGETQQPTSEEIKEEKHEAINEEPKADALAFNPFTQTEPAKVEEPVKEEEPKQDALLSNPFGETQPSAEEKHEEATEQKSDAIAFNPFSQPEPAKEEPAKEETAAAESKVEEEEKEVHIIPPPEVPVEGDERTLPRAPSIHLVPSESSSVDNFEKYDPFSKVIRERSVELDISDDSISTTTESEVHRSTQSNPVFSDHIESISKNKSHNNLSLKAPAEIDLNDFNNYVKSVLPQKEIVGQRVTPKKVIRRHKTKSAGPAGFDSLVEDKLSSNVQTDFNPFGNQVEKKHEDPKDALMFNPFGEDGTSATPAAAPLGVGSPVIKRPPPIPHATDDDDDTNRSRKRLDFNPLTAPKKKKKSKKIIVEPVFNPFKDKDKSMVKSNSQHMIVGERFNNDIDRELKFLRTDNRMERVENSPFDVSPQEPIKNFDQTIAARVLTKFCNEHFNQPAAFRF